MPQLSFPAANAITPDYDLDVYLNGSKRSSVIVSSLDDSAGLDPAQCVLLFPTRDYGAHPCNENDKVIIYVNRRYRPKPLFRGYVTGFGDFQTQDDGEYIQVFCLDELVLLNWDCVDRDYNIRDTHDVKVENFSIRQIAQDIQSQINSNLGTAGPNLMTWSFPRDDPGEMTLLGQPYNSALSTLLDAAGDGKFFYRREYTQSATLVYAFRIGHGEIVNIVRGTDKTSGPRSQHYGVANVGEVRRTEQYVDVVNKAVVIGDRKVKESALVCTKAWDTGKDDYLTEIEAYTKKGTEDNPNPLYDPEAERIGRAWTLPRVTQTEPVGFSEYPELESRLLGRPDFLHTNNSTDFGKPFVVYQFAGEATYNVTWDYNVRDNEIYTAKALIKGNATAGASLTPELASSVWFNTAYKERERLTVNISKQGAVDMTIKRYFQRPEEFKYKCKSAYFTIATAQVYDSTLGVTVTTFSGSWNAGSSIMVDSTATATSWGQNRLRATRDERLEITYVLPRMDLNYKVGQRVKENNKTLDANVFSVEYDLLGRTTTLRAVSR